MKTELELRMEGLTDLDLLRVSEKHTDYRPEDIVAAEKEISHRGGREELVRKVNEQRKMELNVERVARRRIECADPHPTFQRRLKLFMCLFVRRCKSLSTYQGNYAECTHCNRVFFLGGQLK